MINTCIMYLTVWEFLLTILPVIYVVVHGLFVLVFHTSSVKLLAAFTSNLFE